MSKDIFLPASNIKKVNFNPTVKIKKVINLSQYDEHIDKKLIENIDSDSIDKELIENTDPTDIKDDDEVEILNTFEDPDQNIETDIYLTNLMEQFLNKYPHLDNFKNKKIIYYLCEMLVKQLPTHKDNQMFYINLLESSIKEISKELDDLM